MRYGNQDAEPYAFLLLVIQKQLPKSDPPGKSIFFSVKAAASVLGANVNTIPACI